MRGQTKPGHHKATGRSLGYGALAADAAKVTLDKEPAIKAPEAYTLVGTPRPRLDVPLKINRAPRTASIQRWREWSMPRLSGARCPAAR